MYNDNRGNGLGGPSVVTPGFTQTVAGDFSRDINGNNCGMNNPPCLNMRNCFSTLAVTGKDIIAMTVRKIQFQCKNNLFIQGNRFPGLFSVNVTCLRKSCRSSSYTSDHFKRNKLLIRSAVQVLITINLNP